VFTRQCDQLAVGLDRDPLGHPFGHQLGADHGLEIV
jgi:hypothetical protein